MPRLAILVALAVSACAPERAPSLDELAEQYVRLTLEFAQHQPSLVETWLGPDGWRPGPRRPVADLAADLDRLLQQRNRIRRADAIDRPRLDYLSRQLRALDIAARRLLGESMRIDEEQALVDGASLTLAVRGGASPQLDALAALLPGDGPLVDRVAGFRRRFVIPPDRFDAVFDAAVAACRRATVPYIPLPADERVEIHVERINDLAASAEYLGGHATRVRVASREGHDAAHLLRLACHETYPGHHVQHILIDDALVRGRRWTEFRLSPAFGAHLATTEVWAELGADLALPTEARATLLHDALLPLAGIPATMEEAHTLAAADAAAAELAIHVRAEIIRYLDNEQSREDAREHLRAKALILNPDAVLALAERRRTVALLYGAGRHRLQGARRDAGPRDDWRALVNAFTVAPFEAR